MHMSIAISDTQHTTIMHMPMHAPSANQTDAPVAVTPLHVDPPRQATHSPLAFTYWPLSVQLAHLAVPVAGQAVPFAPIPSSQVHTFSARVHSQAMDVGTQQRREYVHGYL